MNDGGGSKGLSLPLFSKSEITSNMSFKKKEKKLKTRGVFLGYPEMGVPHFSQRLLLQGKLLEFKMFPKSCTIINNYC